MAATAPPAVTVATVARALVPAAFMVVRMRAAVAAAVESNIAVDMAEQPATTALRVSLVLEGRSALAAAAARVQASCPV
jgi:hypothetical protein